MGLMNDELAGRLLLASPTLLDPNFSRTVVLLAAHGEEGAMGVILNRPSEVSVGEAVPPLEGEDDSLNPVFLGGPVSERSVIFLCEFMDASNAGLLVLGNVGFPASDVDVDEIVAASVRRRLFAGYAGWAAGQLESELERGDWITHSPILDDLFSDAPEDLWGTVLTRMGGNYALIARMPLDPSVN